MRCRKTIPQPVACASVDYELCQFQAIVLEPLHHPGFEFNQFRFSQDVSEYECCIRVLRYFVSFTELQVRRTQRSNIPNLFDNRRTLVYNPGENQLATVAVSTL